MVKRECVARHSTRVDKRAGRCLGLCGPRAEEKEADGQGHASLASSTLSPLRLCGCLCCLFRQFLATQHPTRVPCPCNATTGRAALFAGCWLAFVSSKVLTPGWRRSTSSWHGEQASCMACCRKTQTTRAPHTNTHSLSYTFTQPSTTFKVPGAGTTWCVEERGKIRWREGLKGSLLVFSVCVYVRPTARCGLLRLSALQSYGLSCMRMQPPPHSASLHAPPVRLF